METSGNNHVKEGNTTWVPIGGDNHRYGPYSDTGGARRPHRESIPPYPGKKVELRLRRANGNPVHSPGERFDPDYCRRATEEFRMASFLAGQGCEFSLNDLKAFINNNVMVLAATGQGKTTAIATPNLYMAVGSMFVCDPKGSLYKKFAKYFRRKGYKVCLIDFKHPAESDGYNPMDYIHDTQDILKLAHYFLCDERMIRSHADPFWEQSAELLLASLIALRWEQGAKDINISSILDDLLKGGRGVGDEDEDEKMSQLCRLFDEHGKNHPDSYACKWFNLANSSPNKTYDCIRVSLAAPLARMDSRELREMMQRGGFDFTAVATQKTIVFVSVSDTDRSMDMLVNLFFDQAMNELCDFADDECQDGRLPIPVRFFLDDFATNVHIEEFPRMIASFRSRAISVVLMLQSESQLEERYREDARTIISNCSTIIYLGGNDIETARSMAVRCDCPVQDILNMSTDTCWVIRSGQEPVCTKRTEPWEYIREMEL